MERTARSKGGQQTIGETEEINPFQSFAISPQKSAEVDSIAGTETTVGPKKGSKRKAGTKDADLEEKKSVVVDPIEETEGSLSQPPGRKKGPSGAQKPAVVNPKAEAETPKLVVNPCNARASKGKGKGAAVPLTTNPDTEGTSDPSGNFQLPGSMPIEKRQELLLSLADELVERLAPLKFRSPPVTCVYNPLVYAREPYEQYIRTCGGRPGVVMLIGMNPGPWGMAQTGIPFGDTVMVRDFIKINGKVNSPEKLHPKRPVDGFACPRREVSGSRLWGWAQQRYGTAEAFFSKFWVYNYCPLSFMEATGKNRTPDKLHPSERDAVVAHCDAILARTIAVVEPRYIIGLGKYAANRAKQCGISSAVPVGDVLHPSPASPAANKDWAGKIESQLRALGIEL